ncbi:MAG: SPASM domain-containing protein [Nitrospiraceae bacterium]
MQTRRGCLAGTRICFVFHCGVVFPCGYLPVSAGNVRKQSFASIWAEAPVFEELRDPDLLLGK